MNCTNNDNKDSNNNCTQDMGRGCTFCSGCGDEGCESSCKEGGEGKESSATACPGCYKLNSHDWLAEMPDVFPDDIFEVRFKNTRKSYFKNINDLPLKKGDIVAVEASPGHDIGIVSLTGDLVARQMKRVGFNPLNGEFKKIYRKAKPADIDKWQEAIALEHNTMIKSRQIAAELGLNMKIGDVEYQGDKIKAIFYYIADERVDFRELIKIFADQFRIRIEMKQIGARQEAGRIGGLGSCGRELCCASWISNFVSVTTNAARHQEISLNPQKLAGQCGKLKCCLVYELDTYLDARKDFPRINQPLQALDGDYFLVKTDILSRTMWFSSDPRSLAGMQALSVDRVKEILKENQAGRKIDQLVEASKEIKVVEPDYMNVVGEDSLTRFDKEKKSGNNTNNRRRNQPRNENGGREGGNRNAGTREGGNRGGGNRNAEPGSGGVSPERAARPANTNVPREPRSNNDESRPNGSEAGSNEARPSGEARPNGTNGQRRNNRNRGPRRNNNNTEKKPANE